MKRSIIGALLVVGIFAAPTAALGAASERESATVPDAGIELAYPADWVRVDYGTTDFDTMFEAAHAQDPRVTRRQVREWADAARSVDASFFAMERRSGDNVLVTVRGDDFDEAFFESSVAQLESDVKAEVRAKGLKLLGHVQATNIGSGTAYRWSTSFGGTESSNLYFAHPETNATVAVTVTTDNDASGRRVARSILDSVALSD